MCVTTYDLLATTVTLKTGLPVSLDLSFNITLSLLNSKYFWLCQVLYSVREDSHSKTASILSLQFKGKGQFLTQRWARLLRLSRDLPIVFHSKHEQGKQVLCHCNKGEDEGVASSRVGDTQGL